MASRPRVLVAFAAEYVGSVDELVEKAREKLEKYDADIVIANRVGVEGVGFASPKLEAAALFAGGEIKRLGAIHKEVLAAYIADWVSKLLGVEGCEQG
jgi:phosphopantothenoylcysteine decarboxylase/phosphopantothenate--cysteine ligase